MFAVWVVALCCRYKAWVMVGKEDEDYMNVKAGDAL